LQRGIAWYTYTGMSETDLTPRQREALAAVKQLRAELGKDPSINEVAGALGLTKAGAHRLLNELVKKKHITKPEILTVKGWRLTPKASALLKGNQ
jgi:DNA-binding MarR family transcriptional regulator